MDTRKIEIFILVLILLFVNFMPPVLSGDLQSIRIYLVLFVSFCLSVPRSNVHLAFYNCDVRRLFCLFFFSLIHYRFWIHFACNLCYFYYCLLLGSLQIKRYVSKHSRTNGCDTTEAKQTQFNISFANIFFFFFAIRFLDTWFEITDCSQVSVCIFPPMICLSVEETIAKYRWWITHLIR